jgi:transcriptional regulator GlxA family with amidase domain
MNPKRIGFLGFEGVSASDLTRAADVFAAATLDGGYGNRMSCYHLCTIGFTSECFRAESGIAFRSDNTPETAPELDTIVVPGGNGLQRPFVSERITDWILTRINQTRRIAAIGTGIHGVAPTGLLDGREVTTNWRDASDVVRRFPNLRLDSTRQLVRDGAFYTSSGPRAAIDLSFALIEEDYGRPVALAAAQDFVMPSVNGNGQHNLPRPAMFDSQPADRFADLIPWIMRNLHEDLSVNTLARRVCMSPSHFNRAFKNVFGSPKWIKGLTLSADWWHIDMRDIVATLGAQTIILENPPPTNGASTVTGGGGAVVVRAEGSNPGEPGPVTLVIDPSNNLSGAVFEGLDYEGIYILDSSIFGHGDFGRLTTTVNGTWLSRAEFQASPNVKRVGINGEFLPPGFALTSSLPWHRANFSIFYDGPADTWAAGLDVGAVVHWIGQFEDDNASLTGSTKLNEPREWPGRWRG